MARDQVLRSLSPLIEVISSLGQKEAGDLISALAERESRTGLRGLQLFKPVDYLDDYARRFGSGSPSSELIVASPAQVERVGQWYADAPMYDLSPETEAAYRAMADQTLQQFDVLTKPVSRGGLGVDVSVSATDPYDTATLAGVAKLIDDLNNRRLSVLSTETTGGHPFFGNDINDMFRAVHDSFGHGATGRGFNRHGEEAAFRSHAKMFSPEALPALMSETRGQNAYVNKFGDFGPQKVVITPQEIRNITMFDQTGEDLVSALVEALRRQGAVPLGGM
jgi:hypothetical protein